MKKHIYNTKHKIKCSISDTYIIWIEILKPNKDLS